MGSNSPDKLKIPGRLAGRITKTLIYGKGRKSETDLKIDKIKKALSDFTKQAGSKNQGKEKQYKERKKQIQEKLEIRENNNNFPFTWG